MGDMDDASRQHLRNINNPPPPEVPDLTRAQVRELIAAQSRPPMSQYLEGANRHMPEVFGGSDQDDAYRQHLRNINDPPPPEVPEAPPPPVDTSHLRPTMSQHLEGASRHMPKVFGDSDQDDIGWLIDAYHQDGGGSLDGMAKGAKTLLNVTLQEWLAAIQQTSPVLRSIGDEPGTFNRPLVGRVVRRELAEWPLPETEGEEFVIIGQDGLGHSYRNYPQSEFTSLKDDDGSLLVFRRTPETNERLASFGRLAGVGMLGDLEAAAGVKLFQGARALQSGKAGGGGTLAAGGGPISEQERRTRQNLRIQAMAFENDVRSGLVTRETPGIDVEEFDAIVAAHERGETFFQEGAEGFIEARGAAFQELADEQRGAPEALMVEAQHIIGGGVVSHAIEHTGDLTHRMADKYNFFTDGLGFDVKNKLDSVLRSLRSGFGFAREHEQNLAAQAKSKGISIEEHRANVDAALLKYAEAHRELEVFNEVQGWARDAAVALGEQQWDVAEESLAKIQDLMQDEDAYRRAVGEFEGRFVDMRGNDALSGNVNLSDPNIDIGEVNAIRADAGLEPLSAPDIELPPLNTFIKLPRRKSIRPTDSEMGIIQTIASTPEEAQLAVDTIARIRGNYPIGTSKDKFMDIEVTGGKFKDGEFIPKIREQAYAFANRPEGVSPKQWQAKIANSMVTDVKKVVDRANAGDAAAIKILAEARWYRNMTVRLRTEFGGLGDIFADLLGTTSAQTNVKANFANAQEILRRFTRGEFDGEIAAWEARKASGESMKPTLLQQLHKAGEFTLITNAAGKLFNSNSPASMKALLDTFRDIKKGVSPKTPNFATNLIGYRHDATIDVWAGRYIRNKAGLPYIPPAAEKAVSGQHLTGSTMDNPRIGAEFGFGQGVFGEAVGKLNKSGVVKNYDPSIGDMGADDLQAVVWFMEKEKWTKNGWTTKAGEGGSLDYEASLAGAADQSQVETLRGQATATFKPPARRKKETAAEYDQRVQEAHSIHGIRVRNAERGVEEIAAPLERTVLGVSGERPGKIPSNYEQAEIAAEFDDVLRNDSSVTAHKATSTIGRFAGKSERALDVEIITRQNFDPAPLKKRLVEVGIDKDQDAVFISKVIVDPKPEQKVNPGLEMYFSRKKKEQFVQDFSEELRKRGIDGFTYITDARQADRINVQAVAGGADTASLTGIRIQYIPEFDSAPSAARRQKMEDIFDDLVEEYGKRGDISSANTVYYETEVFRRATGTGWMSGGQTYDEYLGK